MPAMPPPIPPTATIPAVAMPPGFIALFLFCGRLALLLRAGAGRGRRQTLRRLRGGKQR